MNGAGRMFRARRLALHDVERLVVVRGRDGLLVLHCLFRLHVGDAVAGAEVRLLGVGLHVHARAADAMVAVAAFSCMGLRAAKILTAACPRAGEAR